MTFVKRRDRDACCCRWQQQQRIAALEEENLKLDYRIGLVGHLGPVGRLVDPSRGHTRVAVVVEKWWLTRSGHRASTRARDRVVLDRHLLPELGEAQLSELTHDEVQAWVNRLASRSAPATVQRCFTVLRQVLNFAVDNRMLPLNPSERITLPRRQPFEARFLRPDELEMLAATVDESSRAAVLIMAWRRCGSARCSDCGGSISI